ncbi:MAG: lactate utilization protein C [Herpetosiphonaceae bacterium]|nr:lactate utilization protein C [Herpetosiphonaceae bacterium]
MSLARQTILRRIRAGLRDVPDGEQPADVVVAHVYRQMDERPHAEIVAQFAERVAEYRATVRRITDRELPEAIAAACTGRGVRQLVVPADIPASWLPAELVVQPDDGLTAEQLDTSEGVLTGCALGIAQTGTIVLDAGPHQGRRLLTLLPDYHLCVVYADQIVGVVPEAIRHLEAAVRDERRPITLISGPSATSDIELNRVEGVHGPRTLHVLIVDTGEQGHL